jgi:hypothetical protein
MNMQEYKKESIKIDLTIVKLNDSHTSVHAILQDISFFNICFLQSY